MADDYGLGLPAYPQGESEQAGLIAVQVVFYLIALTACSLRVISRNLTVHSLGTDDYVMVLATVLSLGLCINSCVGTRFGWGRHITDVSNEDYVKALIVSWIAELLFTITVSAVRISICIFYLRLANTRTYRVLTYCTVVWLTVWGICFVLVTIFQCIPTSAFWHPTFNGTQNPSCIDATIPFGVHGVTNILNDLFVYFLPMPMLWRVQLPRRQRIGVMALFGVGALVCIAEVLRLYYSIRVNQSLDVTWGGFNLWTWEAIEINLAIACACVPALKPLVVRWFPNWLKSVFGRTTLPSHIGASAGQGTFLQMNSPAIDSPGGRKQIQSKKARDYNDWEDDEQA